MIETDDVELTNKITKATNRQTEVKLEAFAGLQPFHKELEAFYASMPAESRLYYERRPGQYDFDPSVRHNRIISIPAQIKSFVSVILEEPQKIHFYYGQLLQDYSEGNESALFAETHDTYPYFVASKLTFLVNEKLRRKEEFLGKWRHHLSAMIRMLSCGPFDKARLSDATYCKRYCENLLSKLAQFEGFFETAVDLLRRHIDVQAKKGRNQRDLPQDARLAKTLLDECKASYFSTAQRKTPDLHGASDKFDGFFVGNVGQLVAEKKFGFVEYGSRRFFFAYDAGLDSGAKVRFRVRKSGDSVEAYDVTRL